MTLYPTRAEAIEREIIEPLSERLEDLLSDPLPNGTRPTVDTYYDVQAIADEVLKLCVLEGGWGIYHCLKPDVSPDLFWKIAEKHARPAS